MAKLFSEGIDPHSIGLGIGIALKELKKKEEAEEEETSRHFEQMQAKSEALQEEEYEEYIKQRDEQIAYYNKLHSSSNTDDNIDMTGLFQEAKMEQLKENISLRDEMFSKYPDIFKMLDELDADTVRKIVETISKEYDLHSALKGE